MARKLASPKRKAVKLEDRPSPDPLSLHDRALLQAETTEEVRKAIDRRRAQRNAGKISDSPQAIPQPREAERAAAYT